MRTTNFNIFEETNSLTDRQDSQSFLAATLITEHYQFVLKALQKWNFNHLMECSNGVLLEKKKLC